jgi:hypothetical protein
VFIVDTGVVRVERQLQAGELACSFCGAVLVPWGHGRPREVRGGLGARFFVRPRRSRCPGCQVTHVLLPEAIWPRRVDTAEVIGTGLEIAALGMGHRQVAAHLGLAEDVRRYFTVALVALADDPVMPDPSGTALADAVSAVAAAHRAAATKWAQMHAVPRWEFAGRAITGRVLTCSLPAS